MRCTNTNVVCTKIRPSRPRAPGRGGGRNYYNGGRTPAQIFKMEQGGMNVVHPSEVHSSSGSTVDTFLDQEDIDRKFELMDLIKEELDENENDTKRDDYVLKVTCTTGQSIT